MHAGHATSVEDAFQRLVGRGCPAYVARSGLGPVGAIEAIRAAGGLAALAHFREALSHRDLLRELIDAGLVGLEVHYRSFNRPTTEAMANADLGPQRQFFWTRRKVLAQAAPGSRRHKPEAPDPQGNPVHAMIRVINLLSAETIDNPAIIRAAKPRLIRRTTIAGAPVEEFRYGNGITLWILTGKGLLRRIHTSRVTGGVTVDLLTHEPVKIELPPVARR